MSIRNVCALALTLASVSSRVFAQSAPLPMPLNDTGSTMCRDANDVYSNQCAGTGQDGAYGRDVTSNDPSDGLAGFSFTKLDAKGAALPSSAASWSCVLDNVTGLMWENKTTDGGLHDANKTFFNVGKHASGDVSNWVLQVNAQGLCGFIDWRLPTVAEQQSIFDYGLSAADPAIDIHYFANPVDQSYWSSQAYVGDSSKIFGMYATVADIEIYQGNAYPIAARLVRSVKPTPNPADQPRFVLDGSEVTDTYTGLIWRRCAEGQRWNGVTCNSSRHAGKYFSFQAALKHAAIEAAITGEAWRVPNIKELTSIADYAFKSPALDHSVFPNNLASFYISSTPPAHQGNYNWLFEADAGLIAVFDPSVSTALRLVRNAP